MYGPKHYHTKPKKKDKDKYHMISLICGIKNMTVMNLSTKKKQIHRHRKHTYVYQNRKAVRKGQIRSLGLADTNYEIDKQDPALQHRELYLVSCNKPYGRK